MSKYLRIGRNDGLEQLQALLVKVDMELQELRDGCDIVRDTNDLLGENMLVNCDNIERQIGSSIRKMQTLIIEALAWEVKNND